MLRPAVILASVALWAGTALAAPLLGEADGFARVFNRRAEALGIGDAISLSNCGASQRKVCQYSGGTDLGILVTAVGTSNDIDEVTVIFGGKNANGMKLLNVIATLMDIYAPKSEPKERGNVVKTMTQILKSQEEGSVELHNVSFKLMPNNGMGLWIIVRRV